MQKEETEDSYLVFHEESEQSCAKAIKLGSAENVLTKWSTLKEPGSLLLQIFVKKLLRCDVSDTCH